MTNPTPITAEELAQWREIEKAATAGPWKIHTPAEEYNEIRGGGDRHIAGQSTERLFGDLDVRENADFIAHARNTYARLLDEVERLRANNGRLRTLLESVNLDRMGLPDLCWPDGFESWEDFDATVREALDG